MNSKTTSASIRVFTDEPTSDFISEALGVSPTKQYCKGELRSKSNPKSSVFEQSIWIYDSGLPDSSELHDHFDNLLNVLEAKRLSLDNIRSRISGMDIFAMFSSEHGQGSAELGTRLLRRLANQNIDVTIDLYPPSKD